MKTLLLLLIPVCAFAADIREQFAQAKVGDYLVLEKKGIYTSLIIKNITSQAITIDEIVTIAPPETSWRRWFKEGYTGNNGWVRFTIDSEGHILDCFSISQNKKLPIPKEHLLTTLFQLNLTPLREEQQYKIGAPPLEGERELRAPWRPQINFNGTVKAAANVFRCSFPHDESDLSDKTVDLYFIKEFPLPVWMHLSSGHFSLIMRALECGNLGMV